MALHCETYARDAKFWWWPVVFCERCPAVQAGLEVEHMSRWHFGTTYVIVARPGRAAALHGAPS